MTVISTSVAVLCCSLFTASLIKLIAPSGKTEKILKLIISLFVLICLTTCIKTIISEIKITKDESVFAFENSENMTHTIDENVLKITGDYLVNYIENMLSVENVQYDEITVTVDADEQGVINITDICIYMDKRKADSNIAFSIIEDDLKITPRVVFRE